MTIEIKWVPRGKGMVNEGEVRDDKEKPWPFILQFFFDSSQAWLKATCSFTVT